MDYSYFDVTRTRRVSYPEKNTVMPEAVCGKFPEKTPLAMAYVPFQCWGDTYDPENALCAGTLFPDLDFPLEDEGVMRNE